MPNTFLPRQYDVVIYGATGFTGQLAATYLNKVIELAKPQEVPKLDRLVFENDREFLHRALKKKGNLKWAIAGRDESKLNSIRAGCSTCCGVILANSQDVSSIEKMAQSTAVLLSFAGPFTLYGTPIVEACVKFGTHYCDSTGEIPWVNELASRLHRIAEERKVKIVPMCGFDCIPSDLGVLFAVMKLRERGANSVVSAKTFAKMKGGMSGGTLTTGMLMETHPLSQNPFALGGGPANEEHLKHALAIQTQPHFEVELQRWTGPFMMEGLNTRVVRKTAHDLAYRKDGKGFRYAEAAFADTEAQAKKMAQPLPPVGVRKALMEQGKLPKPGEGPSFATRRDASFQLAIRAESDQGMSCWVGVSGGEAGYEDTALMCCESALALALDVDALPPTFGFLTPGVAFGTNLVERLQLAGIRFRLLGWGDRNTSRALTSFL